MRGVPFFWLLNHVLAEWFITLGLLLAVFYFVDRRGFASMPTRLQRSAEEDKDTWRLDGLINVLFMLVIIGAVVAEIAATLSTANVRCVAFSSLTVPPSGGGTRTLTHPRSLVADRSSQWLAAVASVGDGDPKLWDTSC